VFSVAGLRAAALIPHHHGTAGLAFTVESPARLLLLALMGVAFLAVWHVLYRR